MNFIGNWLSVIRNCSYDKTYKMAWAKAITEISLELDYGDSADKLILPIKMFPAGSTG